MIVLSVIICTYNREALLKHCLDALIAQFSGFSDSTEVIVVDNNCVDGTAEMVRCLEAQHSWLKYVREKKQGLSNARNCGADHAMGEYLCYLDDDGKPSEAYLYNLHEVLRTQRPDIAGGPIYPYYTTERPGWFKDEFEIRRHSPVSGFSRKCSVSGGNYVIRAELLRRLGMFSPSFGMVGNKTRLGDEKAILLKYRADTPAELQRVFYSQECFIYHHVPSYKMRYRYFVKRGYFSGRALVQLKKESWRAAWNSLKGFIRILAVRLPVAMLRREQSDIHPVMLLQQMSIDAGKISMVLQNKLRLGRQQKSAT
jgi:glycosyltransferase involved in cell wall biosynthesis